MKMPPKHTNRLIEESSPYLRQHAHNPVDWYPWGGGAFEKAVAEDKPILLSIGYSACHWCHVMERESFENEHIASIMNAGFINIKVDMEERPDIDKIYMDFVQMTTGSGGWPMTVFLLPDQKPFFGGTYFPPAPRFNMPGFEQILVSVADAYRDRRDEILHSANEIIGEIRRLSLPEASPDDIPDGLTTRAFDSFVRTFDSANGGFGGAPKFPQPMILEFLMRYHKRTGDEAALEMVEMTCRKMADGGMYDHLGGGFHRYAVDADWLTPHFEKMLYDNAQLARCYVHLFQITKDGRYLDTAKGVLDYVKREMLDGSGGFYSSQDADSEGVEGEFFVWSAEEIRSILGTEQAKLFGRRYGVTAGGNFEGANILNVSASLSELASGEGLPEEEVRLGLSDARRRLFKSREERVKPFRDGKILTAWNGLMLAAFAEAAAVFGSDEYLDIARANADFLLSNLVNEGRLLRTWKDGVAKLDAYLEDYANLADGLLALYEVSGETRYLEEAGRLAETMLSDFSDRERGGFFFTSDHHERLITRSKDLNDNATPSGNSAAADVLLRLSMIYGREEFESAATDVLKLAAQQIVRYPGAFGRSLSTMEFLNGNPRQIVIAGERDSEIESVLGNEYLPFKVVARTSGSETRDAAALLKGKEARPGRTDVYVCENYTCQHPVSSAHDLRRELGITTENAAGS